MSDLISRKALIEDIEKFINHMVLKGFNPVLNAECIKTRINIQPAVEPERTAKKYCVIDNESYRVQVCSSCEIDAKDEHKYCPNCGAKFKAQEEPNE